MVTALDKLKRNPAAILKTLEVGGDATIATEPIQIMFPKRYVNKGMAVIGSTTIVLAVIAILDYKGNYSVVNNMAMVEFSPNSIEEKIIDGRDYYVMNFDKDDVVVVKNEVLKNSSYIYDFFDEFNINANIPWYLNKEEDIGNLLVTARQYTGSKIAKNPVGGEILAATICRDPKNKNIAYRHAVNKDPKLLDTSPSYIGLFNIYNTFKSTVNKLSGSYFKEGIVSAIVNPEEEDSAIERALRA